MVDLRVDTNVLDAARKELTQVSFAAEDLGEEGGRMAAMVPAVGRHGAAQAVARFGDAWLFGVGRIGVQAMELAGQLAHTGGRSPRSRRS